jgi:hypothetical protein
VPPLTGCRIVTAESPKRAVGLNQRQSEVYPRRRSMRRSPAASLAWPQRITAYLARSGLCGTEDDGQRHGREPIQADLSDNRSRPTSVIEPPTCSAPEHRGDRRCWAALCATRTLIHAGTLRLEPAALFQACLPQSLIRKLPAAVLDRRYRASHCLTEVWVASLSSRVDRRARATTDFPVRQWMPV